MMLYYAENDKILTRAWQVGESIPASTIWLDMLSPTPEQEAAVEQFLGMPVPTREEMAKIEVSNRLYEERGALFMTATMLSKVDSGAPQTHPATFIVSEERLITVRYIDTTSFRRFATMVQKYSPQNICGVLTFLMLVETIINRQADILERADREVDSITTDIFKHREPGEMRSTMHYQSVLEHIGRTGDIVAKIHESLVTFSRMVVFAGHHAAFTCAEFELQLTSIRRDIAGLSDHGNHLAARINFLLDATLGMISIQQNGVFRVLSTASLIFLPPTLVAGIYGMNFKMMPELGWSYGYPIAVGIMLVAAILPLAYLKQRKWL